MSDKRVWGVWSEADYYGPHLQSVHATLESAEAEAERRNRAERLKGPFVVVEHELVDAETPQRKAD